MLSYTLHFNFLAMYTKYRYLIFQMRKLMIVAQNFSLS